MRDATPFDVAVVGGGIHGAGIAQAAAAAGYSSLLLEKTGWAAGTSGKSSKLIHGGLRYLRQGQIGLVRESLRERHILCRIAPHLVSLNDFYIPVYRHSDIRPWQLHLGLSAYALLAGLGSQHRYSRLNAGQWHQLAGLEIRDLQAVFRYRDAQTDDSRLTAAVAQSAASLGAELACPATLLKAQRLNQGYRLQVTGDGDRNGDTTTVDCRVLVNAAGPWVNQVAATIAPAPAMPAIDLVQGSHLVLSPALSDACFYMESPVDGRAVFALPWKGNTLLGTTETAYRGAPEDAAITSAEERYLLDTLAHYFPRYRATVAETMTGLRVLPRDTGNFSARSREVIIVDEAHDGGGYLAVYGGKLTGYRATAGKVGQRLKRILGRRPPKADTATLPLP